LNSGSPAAVAAVVPVALLLGQAVHHLLLAAPDRQPQAMQPTSQGENNVCNSFIDNVFEPLEALSMVHI